MDDEQVVRELDQAWNEAYPRCDAGALEQILAEEWTAIDGQGRIIDRQQLLEALVSAPNPFEQHRFWEIRVRLYGDCAIVTGRLSGHGTREGQRFVVDQRYTRVYIRRAECWRALATQVTPVART